jgi:transcriptional regulator with XRE-family HTH domain
MKPRTTIDQVDANVGKRLRFARTMRGMSLETLGKLEGVTFQQIQKYESGANRISASRLAHLAGFLQVPIGWFFERIPDTRLNDSDFRQEAAIGDADLANNETRGLIYAYYGIKNPERRLDVYKLIKSFEPIGGPFPTDSGVWAGAKRRPFASPETG